MCGIVGYIGSEKTPQFLLETLKRLEYRGYDSCGIATSSDRVSSRVFLKKTRGKIIKLDTQLKIDSPKEVNLGVAHTRWATHGIPNQANAHPHFDCSKEIFVVHNGIIENYKELKDSLAKKGHRFLSQTDTEVIPHLIEEEYRRNNAFSKAIFNTVKRLKGSFALVLFKKDEKKLFVVRKDSPLIVGVLSEGFLIASDVSALCGLAKRVATLDDETVGIITKNKAEVYNFDQRKKKLSVEEIKITPQHIEKKDFSHFMLKEIFEQPRVSRDILSFYVKGNSIQFKDLNLDKDYLASLRKVFIFACGTAYHAGFVGRYFLEKYCKLDVEIDVSSEARYRSIPLKKDGLVIAISQSGETADTLACVRETKTRGAKVLGICNVLGSTLTKESRGIIYTLAGPEIGVASTKAYTAQIFSLYLFALYLARLRKTLTNIEIERFLQELKQISRYQTAILSAADHIKKIAKKFSRFGCFLFLGRGINYPSALEGALKLKEISYIPAEGYPAGEMKHGPIALIDEYRAVVCIAPYDNLYEKMVSNIQEIKARKGKVLGILSVGDKEAASLSDEKIYIPRMRNQDLTPLLVALPLQLFAYFVAKNLGCEIDQPRNLAKSVTVE